MSRVFTAAFCFLFVTIAVSQRRPVDSLKKILTDHTQLDTFRVVVLNQLANEEMYDHPQLAGNYAFEAKALSEKINYPSGLAAAYRMLGNSFWAQANQSAALTNFLKGLKVADSIGNSQVQADLMGNLGMVYNDINDYRTAVTYYKASLAKQIQLKNKLREGILRLNVGNGYYRLKKYDSSLLYYQQSYNIITSLKNTRNIIDLLHVGIGEVYGEMGDYDKAMDYLYKAKRSCDTTRHTRGMVHSRMAIAKVMLKQKHYTQSQSELLECIRLAKGVNLKTYVRDGYELLSQVAQAQGNLAEFVNYYKSFVAVKDSIQNTAQTSKIASLQLEYQMEKKELEIEGLKKDARLKSEELKLKNTLLFSSLVGIVLVALFLVTALRSYLGQKKLNLELAAKNEEISRQRSELSRQHDELLTLNEEIRAQQDEVILQRDVLTLKNEKIESLHKKVLEVNQNLEKLVAARTASLQEQNKKMEEYAFINAHKLRAPVASIMGLINLLDMDHLEKERSLILGHLRKSSEELDTVIRAISKTLQLGLSALHPQEEQESKDQGLRL